MQRCVFLVTSGIHTSATNAANKYAKREVRMLKKIMLGGREKGKRRWYSNEDAAHPVMMQASNLSKTHSQGKNATRRVTVLNKLFMKHVTDLMATGEMSTEIIGRGLEISRVRVTTDFQGLLVYWLAKGTDDDIVLDKILRKAAGPLRHELSQLRLMGEVPKITFVRDIQFAMSLEVENLLRKSGHNLEIVDSSEEFAQHRDEEWFPDMRHDMFGLDRESIFEKIRKSVDKSKEAWNRYGQDQNQIVSNINVSESLIRANEEQETIKRQEIELVNFLEQNRQKKKEKRIREERERDIEDVYSAQDQLKYEEAEDYLEDDDHETK